MNTIGDSDNANAYVARGSVKLASGNFLVVGYTNVSAYTGYHGYVAEINSSTGAVVKSATIGATTGWTEDCLFKVVQSSDNTYLHIIGTDNQAFTTAYDFWISNYWQVPWLFKTIQIVLPRLHTTMTKT